MTVGYFAPLPPARTGVADYAAALLAALGRRGRVEAGGDAEVNLYHLGNNQLHRAIYKRALERPGVAVLHDAVLGHFFLGALDERGYVEEFIYNYGEWTRDLARELWRGRARSATDARYFGYPMLKRLAERARVVVVHNPAAAQAVARHAPAAKVVEIPHLFVQPELPSEAEIARFRRTLGIGGRTCIFGVFGHLRESKRLPVILRAWQDARQRGANAALLVAGEFTSSDLARALAPRLGGPEIFRTGYLEAADFWRWAAAVDVCLNLRYPAAGETSGIAIRMMGIGKPVILTAGEEIARFPETACLRVEPGEGEEEMLTHYMIWLAQFPAARREIGRRACAHIAAGHAVEGVAAQYWKVLEECAA